MAKAQRQNKTSEKTYCKQSLNIYWIKGDYLIGIRKQFLHAKKQRYKYANW